MVPLLQGEAINLLQSAGAGAVYETHAAAAPVPTQDEHVELRPSKSTVQLAEADAAAVKPTLAKKPTRRAISLK